MYASNLTFPAYAEYARRAATVAIPVGSFEAHGKHCPLGTDNLIPEKLCRDLDGALGDEVLIAPAINYGYTPNLAAFPGTVSLPAETLISLYAETGRAFARWGAKRVVFMNGHGGNIPMLTIACDRIAEEGVDALAVSWWSTFSSTVLTVCDTQGHAGEDETSAVLALDASLVDDSARSVHLRRSFSLPMAGPGHTAARFPEAMNGDARAASAEKGRALYALLLQKNLELLRRLEAGDLTDPIR